MKKKTIVLTALFVVIGAVALIVSVNAASETTEKENKTESASASAQENAGEIKLTVYYFHGNMRCRKCNTIEDYTKEAVRSNFAEEIESGDVEIKIVNVDKKENEHYIKDYELTTKTVVLSLTESGDEKDWKQLPKTWKLVGDKEKFISYIQEEASKFFTGEADG